jgi:hypothetical protein
MKRISLIFFSISVLVLNRVYAEDDYARLHGWDFDNYSAGQVTWELFQRTFIGVRDDDLMDVAHWEIYDDNVSGGGLCFGMCLLSLAIWKEDGHMGFCKPAELDTAITILHGHQFGHTMINWLTERIMSGEMSNAKVAYDDVEYYLSMDDPPVISMIASIGDGHALVPYRCEVRSSSEWRIYVYDPNRPYRVTSSYYDQGHNYVEIHAVGLHYEWSFDMGSEVWTGNNSTMNVTSIFAIPYSEVLQPQRNPFELGAVLEDLNEVFVGGGGRIRQLSNDKGERLYKNDPNDRTSEPENEPGLQIKNIMAFPFVGGGDNNPDAYIMKEYTGNDLKIDVESTGECYQFYMTGRGRLIRVEAQSRVPGHDIYTINSINTDSEELTIESEHGIVAMNIELLRPGPVPEETSTFRISGLQVHRAAPVSVRVAEDDDALFIKSGSPVRCDLEIVKSSGDEKLRFEQKNVKISAAGWQEFVLLTGIVPN